MAVTGPIADFARREIPVEWDALSGDTRFSEELLQLSIDTEKERVFGSVIATGDEASYPLQVQEYVGKCVAIQVIDGAISYWREQPTQVTTTGTNEVETFENRIKDLLDLKTRLLAEVRRIEPDIWDLLGIVKVRKRGIPALSTIGDPLITPSPQDFPLPFRQPVR